MDTNAWSIRLINYVVSDVMLISKKAEREREREREGKKLNLKKSEETKVNRKLYMYKLKKLLYYYYIIVFYDNISSNQVLEICKSQR